MRSETKRPAPPPRQYIIYPSVNFQSVSPADGTLTRYHVHPARWRHKVPDTMSYAEIALLEPVSAWLHATAKAELRLGQPVLITGAGPIGVVQLLCASASGCSPFAITDSLVSRALVLRQESRPGRCALPH